MTPILVAGGFNDSDNMEVATEGPQVIAFRYTRPEPELAGTSYSVPIPSLRLQIMLRRGEGGWIANAPEVDALGHGETREAALESLRDSIEQYLEFIRDDEPTLAPAIAHHAAFVGLLNAPRGTWFASVNVDAPALG